MSMSLSEKSSCVKLRFHFVYVNSKSPNARIVVGQCSGCVCVSVYNLPQINQFVTVFTQAICVCFVYFLIYLLPSPLLTDCSPVRFNVCIFSSKNFRFDPNSIPVRFPRSKKIARSNVRCGCSFHRKFAEQKSLWVCTHFCLHTPRAVSPFVTRALQSTNMHQTMHTLPQDWRDALRIWGTHTRTHWLANVHRWLRRRSLCSRCTRHTFTVCVNYCRWMSTTLSNSFEIEFVVNTNATNQFFIPSLHRREAEERKKNEIPLFSREEWFRFEQRNFFH